MSERGKPKRDVRKFRYMATAAAITATAAVGFSLVTAPSASADANACKAVLAGGNASTPVRESICDGAYFFAQAVSKQYAYSYCAPTMIATGLPENLAFGACFFAIEV